MVSKQSKRKKQKLKRECQTTCEPVRFIVVRTRPLKELRARDVPRGLDPEDVASDCI